ncbi:hypothetical protein [Isosphaera pallida]|uniref:hypothetical protein n=1 Tax=Isosphaera pallida TaxID=128 RepID=UPI00030E7214|nr:hypothetical protein [Isosphaera pallida]
MMILGVDLPGIIISHVENGLTLVIITYEDQVAGGETTDLKRSRRSSQGRCVGPTL